MRGFERGQQAGQISEMYVIAKNIYYFLFSLKCEISCIGGAIFFDVRIIDNQAYVTVPNLAWNLFIT